MAAALPEEVERKFSSLAAQVDAQRAELSQIRDLRKLANARLDQAISDVERLCGNLGPRLGKEPHLTHVEPLASPIHSRSAGRIREATSDLAPGEDNPLSGDTYFGKPMMYWVPADSAADQPKMMGAVIVTRAEWCVNPAVTSSRGRRARAPPTQ